MRRIFSQLHEASLKTHHAILNAKKITGFKSILLDFTVFFSPTSFHPSLSAFCLAACHSWHNETI